MSDDKSDVGQQDRSRVNLSEPYEVQTFVDAIRQERPNASTQAIRDALDVAASATGSSSRELLTEKVLEILGSD